MATFTRTLRRGMTGEDVRELQSLLQRAGFDPGGVDGIFGAGTETAVKSFQAARGLAVDGAVGPLTLGALNQAVTGGNGQAKGRSLHIGLNHVDTSAYPGYNIPVLRGCINDANDMQALAQSHGFQPAPQLLDAQATSSAVAAAISEAAQALSPGDVFLITYSGHGSQVPDIDGDEPDRYDETWVLYDRQFLDDELYALWGQFAHDVRIVLVSDSCHSATISRDLLQVTQREVAYSRELARSLTSVAGSTALRRAVDGGGHGNGAVREPALVGAPESGFITDAQVRLAITMAGTVRPLFERVAGSSTAVVDAATAQVVQPLVNWVANAHPDTRGVEDEFVSRLFSPFDAADDFHRRETLYRGAKAMARRSIPPSASVLSLSGCQDNQTSLDGRVNGLFTQNMKTVLAANPGSYTTLFRQIMALMPATQTPNLGWVPAANAAFEAQAPFTI
jgi:hypothetical protein